MMNVVPSQRLRCSICGGEIPLVAAHSPSDAPCPTCGSLLWWFRRRIQEDYGVPQDQVMPSTCFVADLGSDSVDLCELALELEEEFSIEIPDRDIREIKTVADAIRYVEARKHP